MARYLAPTTRLEAVNTILATIGGAPVSSLENTGIEDVEIAVSLIEEVTRRVLTHGYNWNTDANYPLAPDASKRINMPTGALIVDPTDKTQNLVIRRHPVTDLLCFWNKDERTWDFEDAVEVNITWGFPFDDLPEEARDYIVLAAGRMFQKRFVGAMVLDRYAEEDEMKAWFKLARAELKSRDYNMFRQSSTLQAFGNRRY